MKCDKCGTELLKGNTIEAATDVVHSDSRCIDTLKAQLASMTKRAQEIGKLHRDEVNRLIDGLHDLSVAKHDAEAKLATAVEGLRAARNARGCCVWDETGHAGRTCATREEQERCSYCILDSTLRAVGIDPSKERGK